MISRTELLLASALVHLVEALNPGGRHEDIIAARSALVGIVPEIEELDKLTMLPLPRRGTASQLIREFIQEGR